MNHPLLDTAVEYGQLANQLLQLLELWPTVLDFISEDALPPAGCYRRRQYERTLCDPETLQLALVLIRRHGAGSGPCTLNELAGELARDEAMRKSTKQRIRDTVLPRVADHYGLFAYQRPTHPHGGTEGYRIWATPRLLDFFAAVMAPALQPLAVAPPPAPSELPQPPWQLTSFLPGSRSPLGLRPTKPLGISTKPVRTTGCTS